jgi:hypothetical protein
MRSKMIDPKSYKTLSDEIVTRIKDDKKILDELRREISPLKDNIRRIQPRSTTSISLVGTDGGNNRIQYDPFLVQLIRVVDSSNNEYCLEAITPSTNIHDLSRKQFDSDGSPKTALGKLMAHLKISHLSQLCYSFNPSGSGSPKFPSWIEVYREVVEWAILFTIIREKEFGSDTLIVFDGLLRSKIFIGDLFRKIREGIEEAITRHSHNRRKVYVVGFAKHSKVLTRYRLSMSLERVLTTEYPAYVEIPRAIEEKSYLWPEYARDDDQPGEINKFVGGRLYFVKFGNRVQDPIWPVDILISQTSNVQVIMGHLLADALNGFPVPFYPLCLQRAHENAALVDFDFDILQDKIFEGIRNILGGDKEVLDSARLQDRDPAHLRYS